MRLARDGGMNGDTIHEVSTFVVDKQPEATLMLEE